MRILVVENDRGFRDRFVELLKTFENNDVMAVPSLEALEPKGVHAQGFGLALIDRRAKNDQKDDDQTGEDFALKLCALGTPTVLVAAFLPAPGALFDFLRTGALSGIASKSMDMLELTLCVEEFKVSHRFPNCVAEFHWNLNGEKGFTVKDWEKVQKRVAKTEASPEDYAVLFRSLIPTSAQKVELEEITPGHGGAALFRVRVSSGDGPVVEEVAIKYGERPAMRSEGMRYDRHVGPLPDGVAAHLRWRKETRQLGAIAYSWVGDSVEDGEPFGPVGGNSQAPARGELIKVRADVKRAGQNVTVCAADASAVDAEKSTLVATMLATMMCVRGRTDLVG